MRLWQLSKGNKLFVCHQRATTFTVKTYEDNKITGTDHFDTEKECAFFAHGIKKESE